MQQNFSIAKQQLFYEKHDPVLKMLCAKAARHNCWIHVGSLALLHQNDERAVNRSFVINDKGDIVARYDKLHMFDITLPNGTSFCESNHYRAGQDLCMSTSPWGNIGLSICYDLRFANLYRKLAIKGSDMLAIPAAFTQITGEAHWHVLLRARAIETGCYVFAAAQCGVHDDGRTTYGHSMIIDPWGKILIEAKENPEIIYAELDLMKINQTRKLIPTLAQDKTESFFE